MCVFLTNKAIYSLHDLMERRRFISKRNQETQTASSNGPLKKKQLTDFIKRQVKENIHQITEKRQKKKDKSFRIDIVPHIYTSCAFESGDVFIWFSIFFILEM